MILITFILICLSLTLFIGTLIQWVFVISEFVSNDTDYIITKRDFVMWLIPMYMPIKDVIKVIIDRYNKLD